MSDRPTYIYALLEPGSVVAAGELPSAECVRYVGRTVDLARRMRAHYQGRGSIHRKQWIQKVRSEGKRPVLAVLETVASDEDWAPREQYWIAHYHGLGSDLTNLTEGGGGTYGFSHTDDARQRITEAQHALWTPEKRAAHGDTVREALNRPDVKQRHTEGVGRGKRTKEARTTASRNLKARFESDPSSYEKMRAGLTPDVVARRNENLRANGMTPEFKAKMSAINREIMARPEVKEKRRLNRERKKAEREGSA